MRRRLFFASGLNLLPGAASAASATERLYRFATAQYNIEVRVEFHDRYASRGFWFRDRIGDGAFCLSLRGERNQGCADRFVGSLAIAQYKIWPRLQLHPVSSIREYVRTIDRDSRLDDRHPVDRRIELRSGFASDIQAFGYEESGGLPAPATAWYYFRQDLFLGNQSEPFLIVHWKHELNAIRMLDIIPGDGTRPVKP